MSVMWRPCSLTKMYKRFGETYHSIKTDSRSVKRAEEIKYLGTTATNQNSNQEEIKSRMKSGYACYHSVQNILSSSLLSKNTRLSYKSNFACCLIWAWNLVPYIEGET